MKPGVESCSTIVDIVPKEFDTMMKQSYMARPSANTVLWPYTSDLLAANRSPLVIDVLQ